MSKYAALYHALRHIASDQTHAVTTFADLEAALGHKLPHSAYTHRQWWANTLTTSHSQAWLAAGWRVQTVHQGEQWVQFHRQ